MNFKEYCLLNQKNFDKVKSIEKHVYPSRMHTYQDFDNIEDLLDYADCNGQIDCIVKDDWYAIFCNGSSEVEIIDFASKKPLGFTELIEVKNKLQSFGDKIITMNARESTSYRLIMLAAKRGMFEILSDEPNNEFGEPMHQLELKIKSNNSFKEWLILQEAIDASTKELLLKAKAPKDQLDAFIKELEAEPNLIDKKTAFTRFQTKFNIQKKEKDEDAQRKHFASIPNTTEDELKTYDYYKKENPQSLKEMMELLRKFISKNLINLKLENEIPTLYRNNQKLNTPDFTRFMSALHGIDSELKTYASTGKFNPMEEELNHQKNLVKKGDKVWVFKGQAPDVCRIYGKGNPWCISSSTSATYWFSYRIQHHQTQYFVFDFNKDENDPARYVNPGVAPEGMYSEWVDARNQHSTDPEDSNSDVGINGYRSINQYKKYLASKGIPESIWTTTEPEDWEKRLADYNHTRNFNGAKNDSDSRVFPLFLKTVSAIKDSEFESLDKYQKQEYVLGKAYITDKQIKYAMDNFKGVYLNSLNLDGKIYIASKINDQDLLLKLAQNEELSDNNVEYLLDFATDKEQMAEIIAKYKSEHSADNVSKLLKYAKDKDKMVALLQKETDNISKLSADNVSKLFYGAKDKNKMAELLGKDNISKLSDNSVRDLLDGATDKEQMAALIIKYKSEHSAENVRDLLCNTTDKDKIAELIKKYKSELSNDNVSDLLKKAYTTDKDKIAELIIQYNSDLSDNNVHDLYYNATDKEQMAALIIKYKSELSDYIVSSFLRYAQDKDKIAELIIQKKPELSHNNVQFLLHFATDKDKIVVLLQKDTDNISKLRDWEVSNLLSHAKDKKQMAQILNKYHTKKTPQIQQILDKYLS